MVERLLTTIATMRGCGHSPSDVLRGTKRSVALGLIDEHIFSTISTSIEVPKPWHISLENWGSHMELCRACNDKTSPRMVNGLSDAIMMWDNL